jgi:hypothetical protein
MNKKMEATKGLVIARIVAVSLLALCSGIMAYGWISGNEIPDAAAGIFHRAAPVRCGRHSRGKKEINEIHHMLKRKKEEDENG